MCLLLNNKKKLLFGLNFVLFRNFNKIQLYENLLLNKRNIKLGFNLIIIGVISVIKAKYTFRLNCLNNILIHTFTSPNNT